MGLKIFISYAHHPDPNVPLVERITADLKAAGHEPWIDTAKIKFTDDWRREILAGITASDAVLAFLSQRSTRDPGVCLDELAIALHVKGGNIAPVLVEPETDVKVPVSVGHIQWLDMSDWAARQAADPAAFEAWYRDKFATILARLADRGEFAGEIAELRPLLQPVSQAADIRRLTEGFVGRRWLLDHVDTWRKTGRQPIFWLNGRPGTGKSAFSAWLTHSVRSNVISLNLCDWGNAERRDPARIIRTLAFLLATRLPDYRHELLRQFLEQDPKGVELRGKGAAALFDWLLAEPLGRLVDGGRAGDRMLVVIDALDETLADRRCELAELLGERAGKLPSWIALLVTSRRLPAIETQFADAHAQPIDAEDSGNDGDLRDYARGWLGAADPALLDRIVRAADGVILYLDKLREAKEQYGLDLTGPGPLPRGLIGLYERWFFRLFPTEADFEPFVNLLQVLVAARNPVPETLLTEILSWAPRDRERVLARLAGLFERGPAGVRPFHASLRDWLTEPHHFFLDAALGSRDLADALWRRFNARDETAPAAADTGFLLAELPAQVLRQAAPVRHGYLEAGGGWQDVAPRLISSCIETKEIFGRSLYADWLQLTDRLGEAAGADALATRHWALTELGEARREGGDGTASLQAYQAAAAVADRILAGDAQNPELQRESAVSGVRIADILLDKGDLPAATVAYRAALATIRLLAAPDPGNAQWQRDLSVSHNKIGDVLVAQGELPQAEQAFRDGMDIRKRLAAQDPGNAQWQRDLSVSHNKIGDVLVAQGELTKAEQAFRDGMDIRQRLAAQDPGNAQWQRDLSVSHNKIGDVLVAQGELPQAEQAFRDGMDIRKRLAAQDPGNAQWQRDLSVSHNKIGDVLVAQGELTKAEQAFRDGMDIRQRLAAQDPGNAQWQRDLSVSHNKIGDVLVAQGELPQAEQAFRDGMDIARRLAAQDPGNAQWQRDLSISYERIGDVLVAQGELPQAEQAFRDGMDIARRLAAQDPGNAQWQRDVLVSLAKRAGVAGAAGDGPAAAALADEALTLARALVARFPNNPQHARDVPAAEALVRQIAAART